MSAIWSLSGAKGTLSKPHRFENTGQISTALICGGSKQVCGAWWMASPLIFTMTVRSEKRLKR